MSPHDREPTPLARRRLFAGGATAAGVAALSGTGYLLRQPDPVSAAAPRTDLIDVRDHGAVGDGDADDTAAIRAAVAAAVAAGGGVVGFGANRTYRLTGPLELPIGNVGYQGSGSTLNCVDVPDTAGHAVHFVPSASTAMVYTNRCEGLRILGPASEARTLDGIVIGRPATAARGDVAGSSFHNILVYGFRDNWTLADQSWMFGYYHCASGKAWRRGYDVPALVNAGENYNWHGGLVYDCHNAAGTAVGVHADKDSNSDLNFFGVSFDYNDIALHVSSGAFTLIGCHLEDASTGPMAIVTSITGREPAKLDLVSCMIAGTRATERRSFVTVAGERSIVRISGGSWPRYGHADGELVTVLAGPPGGGAPLVSIEHVDPVISNGVVPRISGATSLIHNGDFEQGLIGWQASPGNAPTGRSAAGPAGRNGSRSLTITNTGAGVYGLYTEVPCTPGGRLLLRGYVRTAAGLPAENAGLRLDWLDFAGTPVAPGGRTIGANPQRRTDWIQCSAAVSVPVGATRARIWVWTSGLNGQAWFDDVEAWML